MTTDAAGSAAGAGVALGVGRSISSARGTANGTASALGIKSEIRPTIFIVASSRIRTVIGRRRGDG